MTRGFALGLLLMAILCWLSPALAVEPAEMSSDPVLEVRARAISRATLYSSPRAASFQPRNGNSLGSPSIQT